MRIVGIAGGTASGKTTMARKLADRLDALLIAHDRYYRDAPDPRAVNFDAPEALDTARLVADLDRLRSGNEADLPVYDFSIHRRAATTERVRPAPLVIVEGILVLADPDLRARFDVRVYVDAPADLRLARRVLRDMAERGRTAASVIDQYLRQVRPMHERWVDPSRAHADVVLDGEGEIDCEFERLAGAIASGPSLNLR